MNFDIIRADDTNAVARMEVRRIEKSIYESIDHAIQYPAKIFVTNVENSSFHWHYDCELIVVLQGELLVHGGPNPMQMKAGDIYLLNCKTVHGYRSNGNSNLCLFIQFSPKIFSHLLPEKLHYNFYLNSVSDEFPIKTKWSKFVETACKIGWYSRRREVGAEYRTQCFLYQFFADLLDYVEHDARRGPNGGGQFSANQLAMDITSYLDDNCDNPTLQRELCKQFSISEKTLYRTIKNELGMSPKELIDTARIEKSKRLLRNSDVQIIDIPEQCGYSSMATFYRVFRKEVGMAPKEYREGGTSLPVGGNIQGYLSFDGTEADSLLKRFAGINK